MENEKRVKIRKQEALIITVLFAILALNVCVGCVSAATTYTISSSGGDGASIQAAINAADPGDTIEVLSGIYYELVNVKKQLALRGVDTGGGKPVVDARLRGSAITLTADGITLEGFAVTNGTGMGMMEFLWTAGITNNTVSNSSQGIYIDSSCNNIITNNTVTTAPKASPSAHGIPATTPLQATLSATTKKVSASGIPAAIMLAVTMPATTAVMAFISGVPATIPLPITMSATPMMKESASAIPAAITHLQAILCATTHTPTSTSIFLTTTPLQVTISAATIEALYPLQIKGQLKNCKCTESLIMLSVSINATDIQNFIRP